MSTDLLATAETEWRLPSPRKVGLTLVILTESSLFTIFVVAYLFYIGKSLNPPYPWQVLEFPWLGSLFLFSSSGTVVAAEHKLKKGDKAGFELWWLITALLGLAFLIYTGTEWYSLIYHDGLTLSTNLFGSTFYSLVGLHASHVVVGFILLTLILVASVTGNIKPRHHEHIEMISWYWHFVDGIWAVVVTVVYIIGMQH